MLGFNEGKMEAAPPTYAKASEDRPPPPFTGGFYSQKKLIVREFKLQSTRLGEGAGYYEWNKKEALITGLFF